MANPRVTAEERGQKVRKNGRGSTANTRRLEGLQPVREPTGSADWGNASRDWIAVTVAAAVLKGFIISFSLSRDGGAHGLSLYGDGERVQLWFNGDADLDVELEKVFSYLEALQ